MEGNPDLGLRFEEETGQNAEGAFAQISLTNQYKYTAPFR